MTIHNSYIDCGTVDADLPNLCVIHELGPISLEIFHHYSNIHGIRLALILILTMRSLQKFANDTMCCDGMCKICSDLMSIKMFFWNGSLSPFYIDSWARSQPMREDIPYVRSSIIGWKLALPWIETGPWSYQPVIISSLFHVHLPFLGS